MSRPGLRLHLLSLCAATLSILIAGTATRARAAPAHDWGYPFCGPQPSVTSVYDHEYPTYTCPPNGQAGCVGGNGIVRLFNDTVQNRAYDGHNGWDYRTRDGDGTNTKRRVYAVAAGRVVKAGWDLAGDPNARDCAGLVADHERAYGLMVIVDHGGEQSLYAHLSAVLVEEGQNVARGQVIGSSGTTGNSSGPHLHFGAFRGGAPAIGNSFDPYGWDEDWTGESSRPLPPERDPWFLHSGKKSERRLLPAAPDSAPCPLVCGATVVVDDRDPGFQLGCARPPCNAWFRASSAGYNGYLYYTYPNGRRTDHWARWTAALPAGTYDVDVYVPKSRRFGITHAARYQVNGREMVVDQHREGGIWVKLGIHAFLGAPAVTLLDASYVGPYSYIGTCQNIAADAGRLTPVCLGGIGPG